MVGTSSADLPCQADVEIGGEMTVLARALAILHRGRLTVHPKLIGEDHRLHPVARAELGEDSLDVGLDRGLLDDECALSRRSRALAR
jgi:hypothetical protein